MEEQIQIVELGEKTIKEIAKEVHKLNKAEKRKLKDNAYHNTKLLLTNYHKLKSHCEVVKEEITTNLDTTWKEDRFALNSLLENKIKTTKLMDHVDKSLEKFKDSEIEEYRLIRRKYFSNVKSDDMTISVEYDVDRRTISRRIDKAVEDLSIILFGIDVLF